MEGFLTAGEAYTHLKNNLLEEPKADAANSSKISLEGHWIPHSPSQGQIYSLLRALDLLGLAENVPKQRG